MKINIRPALQGDIPVLCSFLSELFSIEPDFCIDEAKQSRALAMLIDDAARSAVLVAESDAIVIGMVTGQLVVSTSSGAYSVLLEDFFVAEGFRGNGVGALLLDELRKWGTRNGAVRMQLVAENGNTGAIRFYASKNFSESRMIAMYRKI